MKRHELKILCLLACLSNLGIAQTWNVAAPQSLQQTIDRAQAGDTINVAKGTYCENLHIDKALTLRGIKKPILDGQSQQDIIRIRATDVIIEGFIIRRSGNSLTQQNSGIYLERHADRAVVKNNVLAEVLFGIWIEHSNDVVIEGNLITGLRDNYSSQRGNGIQLYDTSGAKIIGNHISFVRDGIYVDVSHDALFARNRLHDLRYGTHYMNSNNNVLEDNESFHNRGGLALMEVRQQIVRRNKVWGNSDHGIMLRTITDAHVSDNIIIGNARGIFMYDAEYNKIKDNLIANNQIGLHIWAGSIHNQFEGNDIVHNREQTKYIAAHDQLWGQQSGNFWSNHLGWDRNNDGIGDQAFVSQDAIDRLLWRTPSARLLMSSPAIETLHHIAAQFPVLRAPSVVEQQPLMRPRRAIKEAIDVH